MWLRNYDNILCSMFGAGAYNGGGAWNTSTFADGSLKVKNYLGTEVAMMNFTQPSGTSISNSAMEQFTGFCVALSHFTNYITPTNGISYSAAYPFSFIAVGSGTTTPTYDDYNLEAIHSSSLTHLGYKIQTIGYNDTDKSWGKRITRSFRNSSSNTITISEIGVYGCIPYGSNKTSHCLLYREVLDTPITVEADQKFEVSVDMYCQMIHHPDL